jgi:hypothetical protein
VGKRRVRGADLRRWITEGLGLSLEIVQRRSRWVWVHNDVEPDPIPAGFEVIRRRPRWNAPSLDLPGPKEEVRLRVLGPDSRSVLYVTMIRLTLNRLTKGSK